MTYDEPVLICTNSRDSNEFYFGNLWVERKNEDDKYVGELTVEGLNKKQKQILKDFAEDVQSAYRHKVKSLEDEIYDLSPDYTITYSPCEYRKDSDFELRIKDIVIIPNCEDRQYSHYQCATKVEAEKKAKQLIKLCEENS